jgi:hypothetical protein
VTTVAARDALVVTAGPLPVLAVVGLGTEPEFALSFVAAGAGLFAARRIPALGVPGFLLGVWLGAVLFVCMMFFGGPWLVEQMGLGGRDGNGSASFSPA